MKFFKIKNLSVKWQLCVVVFILVIVPVMSVTYRNDTYYSSGKADILAKGKERLEKEALLLSKNIQSNFEIFKKQVENDFNTSKYLFLSYGTIYQDSNRNLGLKLNKNDNKDNSLIINNNFTLNQILKQLTGKYFSIYALSNFRGEKANDENSIAWNLNNAFYSVSSAIERSDGTKIVDNILPLAVYEKIIKEENFRGIITLDGKNYYSTCSSINDVNNNIIGAICLSDELNNFLETINTNFLNNEIENNGEFSIINNNGEYLLSKNNIYNGKNVKEIDNSKIIEIVLADAPKLAPSKSSFIKTSDIDSKLQLLSEDEQMIGYSYIPELKWTVISKIFKDDLMGNFKKLDAKIILIAFLSSIGGIIILILFSIFFTRPITKLEKLFHQVDSGDLDVKIDHFLLNSMGEIGRLAHSFYKMVDNLKSLVSELKINISTTAASAEQLSASAQQVNASMQQFSATIEAVASGAIKVSKGIDEIKEASKSTSESAEKGGRAAQLVIEKMKTINLTTKEGSERISALDKRSSQISEIIDTINSISEQTNLLALNAAIEAARAGEAGRGFAVVAGEVRKLAEESSKATEEIANLISTIKNDINLSVNSMSKSSTQVVEGSNSIQDALKSFEIIPVLVDNVNLNINKIISIAEENTSEASMLNSTVQQVTSAMQQVSSAAQQLSVVAEGLNNLASRFKVTEEALTDIKFDSSKKVNEKNKVKIIAKRK